MDMYLQDKFTDRFSFLADGIEIGVKEYSIFAKDDTVIAVCGFEIRTYKVTKLPKDLTEDERDQVLSYSGLPDNETVTIKDIFIHGEFVKLF